MKSVSKMGSLSMQSENYPLSGIENHPRWFQHTWFSMFPSWLEYSSLEDVAYCL